MHQLKAQRNQGPRMCWEPQGLNLCWVSLEQTPQKCPPDKDTSCLKWWAEPAWGFAEGGKSGHQQGPGLQPEHRAACGKKGLLLPLSTTTLSWALRLRRIFREWRLHLTFGGAHATPRQSLDRNECLRSNYPLTERLELERQKDTKR